MVILNGDQPARALEAARLYRAGVAPEVWLTSDPRSARAGEDAGTRSNVARLTANGVPRAAIHFVPGAATSTRAELEAIAAELRRGRVPCAILVTSGVHGRRVRITWDRVVGDSPRALVRRAPGGGYAGWRADLKELAGIVAAWLRLAR